MPPTAVKMANFQRPSQCKIFGKKSSVCSRGPGLKCQLLYRENILAGLLVGDVTKLVTSLAKVGESFPAFFSTLTYLMVKEVGFE